MWKWCCAGEYCFSLKFKCARFYFEFQNNTVIISVLHSDKSNCACLTSWLLLSSRKNCFLFFTFFFDFSPQLYNHQSVLCFTSFSLSLFSPLPLGQWRTFVNCSQYAHEYVYVHTSLPFIIPRAALSNRNTVWATYVKRNRLHFNSIFYLTQYIENVIISTRNHSQKH